MGSVLLVIHLMVAILLVVLILMQRNSGNALSGLGGGNGADSFLSARGKGNLLTRTTGILATIFFLTSIALSLYYKGEIRKNDSIMNVAPLNQTAPIVPVIPDASAEETTEEAVSEVSAEETTPETIPDTPKEETTEEATSEVSVEETNTPTDTAQSEPSVEDNTADNKAE